MLRWLCNKWQRDLVTMREKREKNTQRHHDRKILCPRCGYDIKGMPDQPCSECGLFIESRWREGWFAANSDLRWGVLIGLGALGVHRLIFGMGIWIYMFLKFDFLRYFLATEPAIQLATVVLVTHWMTALAVIIIAIMRRRYLVHGPRAYTLRVTLLCVTLVLGTGIVSNLVFQGAAASLAN
jgi:ribosomal protein L37E